MSAGYSKTCLATPWLSISSARNLDLVCKYTRRPYISPWRVSFLFANREIEIRNGTGTYSTLPEIASLVSRSCYEHLHKYLSLSQRFLVRFYRPHFFPFTCLNCSLRSRDVCWRFRGWSCYCREVELVAVASC